ncbi:2-hydroxyacyl-CoA dehydratase [Vallitalea pronyensis]|uniref:2-hydroxyacyl-CoA dehydratase n=1 Tax=Vallitalea pronyensis TaxID=1348613 RepID=A0A8J8SFR2_9FIRM|nr:2-hydroxyacyl-CoA dehydratase family protein [Vallitalea pronyensis]QUI21866.1 2-hydroxyacyl-CoA dehydratase [Vallitalea pronyensis]
MKKKILYMCSFVPYGTLEGAGFDMINIADIQQPVTGNLKLSGNLCSFVNYCQHMDVLAYDGIIFTNCCNSMQRLYDYVTYYYPNIFTYMMEIPRHHPSIQVDDLMVKLAQHFGIKIGCDNRIEPKNQPYTKEHIWVISSAMHKNYKEDLIKLFHENSLIFDTCTSENRGDQLRSNKRSDVSCPRMMNYYQWFEKRIPLVKGLIFMMVGRCDHSMFLYPELKRICSKYACNVLYVEEEFTLRISERSKIRYEAFKECLTIKNGEKL